VEISFGVCLPWWNSGAIYYKFDISVNFVVKTMRSPLVFWQNQISRSIFFGGATSSVSNHQQLMSSTRKQIN
jgi:hypothetical protein